MVNNANIKLENLIVDSINKLEKQFTDELKKEKIEKKSIVEKCWNIPTSFFDTLKSLYKDFEYYYCVEFDRNGHKIIFKTMAKQLMINLKNKLNLLIHLYDVKDKNDVIKELDDIIHNYIVIIAGDFKN